MSSTTEELLVELRSLVPLGTQPPSEANIKKAQDTLRKLKLDLVKLSVSSPANSGAEITAARQGLLWQREMLELACFLSLYSRDVVAFERYIAQLKTYYNDYRAVLTPSPNQGPVLGMYLLCLLSQNQIADFHTEYELLAHAATSVSSSTTSSSSSTLPPASPTSARAVSSNALLSSPFIAYPVALEQQLMEGCYHQILSGAKKDAPLQIYSLFTDTLSDTVRGKIADCSEQAYESLSLAELQKMLVLPSADDTSKFVASRKGWAVQGSKVLFANKLTAGNTEINALKTIKQALEYATELDRII